MAPNSAYVIAPKKERRPPTIHTRYTSQGEPASFIITPETRKMPLPMMVPATIAVACQTLSSRNRSGLAAFSVACIDIHRLQSWDGHQAYQVAHNKGGGCA